MDCSLPGSSVHGISQARILEWVTISFSREIFSTQGSKSHLLLWQVVSLLLSYQGSPNKGQGSTCGSWITPKSVMKSQCSWRNCWAMACPQSCSDFKISHLYYVEWRVWKALSKIIKITIINPSCHVFLKESSIVWRKPWSTVNPFIYNILEAGTLNVFWH